MSPIELPDDGLQTPKNEPEVGADPDHRYSYDVTGGGEAVSFQIADSNSFDNYGVLKIEIYAFE